jgi:hypothetical protein
MPDELIAHGADEPIACRLMQIFGNTNLLLVHAAFDL